MPFRALRLPHLRTVLIGVSALSWIGCQGEFGYSGAEDSGPQPETDAGSDATTQDAGARDAGGRDAAPPPAGGLEVFLALGHVGRTVVSCDNGENWFADQSEDDAARCWQPGGPECDHQSNSGVDIIAAEGQVFRTLGWGSGGGIDRSTDGVRWTRVTHDTTWSALAYGHNLLVGFGGWGSTQSQDLGNTFENLNVPLNATSRRGTFFGYGPGRFIVYGDTHVAFSDDGANWTVLRDVLGQDIDCAGAFSYGGGVLILAGSNGICRSTDGGETWSVSDRTNVHSATWTGTGFEAWSSAGSMLTSGDGVTWQSTDIQPAGLRIANVGRSGEGQYVAVEQGWNRYYDQQKFHHSEDGIRWIEATTYQGGHPIRKIISTRMEACPTP